MATRAGAEERELRLLELLAQNPERRQVDLAKGLGVAVGTVNWLLRRLAARGLIEVERLGRGRWRYSLTPEGKRERVRLGTAYVRRAMAPYRRFRQRARELLEEVKARGFREVRLQGEGDDLLDVCRLSCLEHGIGVTEGAKAVPVLVVTGFQLEVRWPQGPRDVPEEALREVVRKVARVVRPERVFVLGPSRGSNGDGAFTAVVVKGEPVVEVDLYGEIRKALKSFGMPMDVMLLDREEYRRWQKGLKRQRVLARWP